MKVFNVLVNAPNTLLRLLVNVVGSLYQLSTKGTPVSYVTHPEATPTYKVSPNNVEVAKKVFSDIEDTPLYKTILAEVVYAKLSNIPTFTTALKNNGLYPIPKTMDAPFESVETRYSSRMSHTVWILWLENGEIDIVTPTPTRGLLLTGMDLITVNDPADAMPHNVVRAAKVILGCELLNNTLRGCRWTHYSKEHNQ